MSRSKFSNRRVFFYFLFGASTLLLLIILFRIQLLDESYKLSANNNVIKAATVYPERGYIYDRNGELLVSNQRAYDLMVTPRQVKTIDTLNFCNIIGIEKPFFDKRLSRAKNYSIHRTSIFLKKSPNRPRLIYKKNSMNFLGSFFKKERCVSTLINLLRIFWATLVKSLTISLKKIHTTKRMIIMG